MYYEKLEKDKISKFGGMDLVPYPLTFDDAGFAVIVAFTWIGSDKLFGWMVWLDKC